MTGEPSPPTPLPEGEGSASILAGRARQIPDALLERARQLRAHQTAAEEILWDCLRGRRLCGVKFRRQHNIGPFIADFYCHSGRIIIELDGAIHEAQRERDYERDTWAASNGFKVLRFRNEEIWNDTAQVLRTIVGHVLPSPSGRGAGGEGGEC